MTPHHHCRARLPSITSTSRVPHPSYSRPCASAWSRAGVWVHSPAAEEAAQTPLQEPRARHGREDFGTGSGRQRPEAVLLSAGGLSTLSPCYPSLSPVPSIPGPCGLHPPSTLPSILHPLPSTPVPATLQPPIPLTLHSCPPCLPSPSLSSSIPVPLALHPQPCRPPTLSPSPSIPVPPHLPSPALSSSIPVLFALHPHPCHPPSPAPSLSIPVIHHPCPLCSPSPSPTAPSMPRDKGPVAGQRLTGWTPLSPCRGDVPVWGHWGTTGSPGWSTGCQAVGANPGTLGSLEICWAALGWSLSFAAVTVSKSLLVSVPQFPLS